MAGAVRVGLYRFVLDAPGSEALEELVEPGDCESDPARARLLRVRLDEERGVLVDVPQHLFPDAKVWGSPKNRVYQSTPTSSSDTGNTGDKLGDPAHLVAGYRSDGSSGGRPKVAKIPGVTNAVMSVTSVPSKPRTSIAAAL